MSSNVVPILFTSAGRRVELMHCFRRDAEELGLTLRVLAADQRPALSAACAIADEAFAVPRCLATDYVPALLEICRRKSVRLLVPTIDTELPVLAESAGAFAEVGTRVTVSSPEVVATSRDKLLTAKAFARAGIIIPRTSHLTDMLAAPAGWRWPVVLKPRGGSSSVGLALARDVEEVGRLGSTRDDYLVQEHWAGREYTVNIFFDEGGDLVCAVPHRRIEIRGGEVSKGRTERMPQLEEAARKIVQALPGARGPMCFQAIVKPTGEYAVFEINARFGGGYPLAHHAGAPFSRWLLEAAAGLPSTAHNAWRENVTMLRYDAAVFLDG